MNKESNKKPVERSELRLGTQEMAMSRSEDYFVNSGRTYKKTKEYLERKRLNQAAYRARQQQANLLAVTCYVHKNNAENLRDFAKTLVNSPKNKRQSSGSCAITIIEP